MANISQYLQEGLSIDYTPSSAVYAGNILNLGAVSAFTPTDIAASALGKVAVRGVIRGPHAARPGSVGDNVWWDADGTPVGGTNDGAFTTNAAAGDWWVGTLIKACATTDATCDIALNKENPQLPPWPNRGHVTTAVDLAWVADDHNGKVIHVTATGKKVTLPTGVGGMEAIIVNDGADGTVAVLVALDGTETCEGNLAIGSGETATNTALTAKRGDYLHLVCETAASLWRCQAMRGIWAVA